jgi:dienelactone hydrolase
MISRLLQALLAGWLLAGGFSALTAAEPGWQTVAVQQTYNQNPFTYRIRLAAQRPGYKIYKLYYPSPVVTAVMQNNTIPAEYFVPDVAEGSGPKRPAVICLHILDGNEVLTDLLCSALARRGIPAIMFKLPYYGEREVPDGPMALAKDPKLFTGAMVQAADDVRRTVDLLASRPEVDPQKIGIAGISLGGLVAASSTGREPRIARVGLVLAGGDLPKIIGHSIETRPLRKTIDSLPADQRQALQKMIADADPLRAAPALRRLAADGRVLMINAAEDEVIPRNCTEQLAAAAGMEKQVVWIDGLGHYTSMAELPRLLNLTADFFTRDLPPGVAPPTVVPSKDSPFAPIADLCRQLETFLGGNPQPGHCHIMDLEFTASWPKQQPVAGRFRCLCGDDHRFVLAVKLPFFGDLSLGQGRFPWVMYGDRKVVKGTLHPGAQRKDFLSLADPRQAALLKMAAGVLHSVADVPEVLGRLVAPTEESATGGDRVIRLTLRNPPGAGSFRLLFDAKDRTPKNLEFEIRGAKGEIEVRDWRINAVAREDLFEPPAKEDTQAVDEAQVYQTFAMLLKYLPMAR